MAEQIITVKNYEEGVKEIKHLLSILTITPFNNEIVEIVDTHGVGVIGKHIIPISNNFNRNKFYFNKIRVFHLILGEMLENISNLTEEQLINFIDFLKKNFKGKSVYNILIKFLSTLTKFDKKQHVIVVETKYSIEYLYDKLFFEKIDSPYNENVIRTNVSYDLFLNWLLCNNTFKITFKPKTEVLDVFKQIIATKIERCTTSIEKAKEVEIIKLNGIKEQTAKEIKLLNDHINEYKDLLSGF